MEPIVMADLHSASPKWGPQKQHEGERGSLPGWAMKGLAESGVEESHDTFRHFATLREVRNFISLQTTS